MADEEEEELRFHPKYLYVNPTPPIDRAWMHVIVDDRASLIAQGLDGKALFHCSKCEALLADIVTGQFAGITRRNKTSTTPIYFPLLMTTSTSRVY